MTAQEQLRMKLAAKWSEIPVTRRHAYVCATLLLCLLAADLLKQSSFAAPFVASSARTRMIDNLLADSNPLSSAAEPTIAK